MNSLLLEINEALSLTEHMLRRSQWNGDKLGGKKANKASTATNKVGAKPLLTKDIQPYLAGLG